MFEINLKNLNAASDLTEEEELRKINIYEKFPWAQGKSYKELIGNENATFLRIKKPQGLILNDQQMVSIIFKYLKNIILLNRILSLCISEKDKSLICLIKGELTKEEIYDLDEVLQVMFTEPIEDQGFFVTVSNERRDEISGFIEGRIERKEKLSEIPSSNTNNEIPETITKDDTLKEEPKEELKEEPKNVSNIDFQTMMKMMMENKELMDQMTKMMQNQSTQVKEEPLEENSSKEIEETKNSIIEDVPDLITEKDSSILIPKDDPNSVSDKPFENQEKEDNTKPFINEFENIESPIKENEIQNTDSQSLIETEESKDIKEYTVKSTEENTKEEPKEELKEELKENSEDESKEDIKIEEDTKEDTEEDTKEDTKEDIKEDTDISETKNVGITENIVTESENDRQGLIPLSNRSRNLPDNKQVSYVSPEDLKLNTFDVKSPKRAFEDSKEEFPLNYLIENNAEFIPPTQRDDYDNEIKTYRTIKKHTYALVGITKKQFDEYFKEIMKYFTTLERLMVARMQRKDIPVKEFMENIKVYIENTYPGLNESDKISLLNRIENALCGMYILEDILNDEKISDVRILNYNDIRIKIFGKNYMADVSFLDNVDYKTFINGMAIRNHVSLDKGVATFTDKNSNKTENMRFTITTEAVNTPGVPYVHIRKIGKTKKSMDELISENMLEPQIADYLIDKVKNSKGIVIAGQSSSGKTTLINTLIDYIPMSSTGTIIQENEELFGGKHPDIMCEKIGYVITPQKDVFYYDLQDLIRNALLTNTEYIIVGEIKGAEARDFISACTTSHKCMATIHSSSAKDVPMRLADLMKYGSDYTISECLRMLKDLEVIVYMSHYKVSEIVEITGYDDEEKVLKFRSIFKRSKL